MPADIYKENGELMFGVFSSMNACLGLMWDGYICVYTCIFKKLFSQKASLNHIDILTTDFLTSGLVLITSLPRVIEARSCGNFSEKTAEDIRGIHSSVMPPNYIYRKLKVITVV